MCSSTAPTITNPIFFVINKSLNYCARCQNIQNITCCCRSSLVLLLHFMPVLSLHIPCLLTGLPPSQGLCAVLAQCPVMFTGRSLSLIAHSVNTNTPPVNWGAILAGRLPSANRATSCTISGSSADLLPLYFWGDHRQGVIFFAYHSFKNAKYRIFYKQNKKILLAVSLCSHIPLHIVVSVAKEALKFMIVSLSVLIALSVARHPLSSRQKYCSVC